MAFLRELFSEFPSSFLDKPYIQLIVPRRVVNEADVPIKFMIPGDTRVRNHTSRQLRPEIAAAISGVAVKLRKKALMPKHESFLRTSLTAPQRCQRKRSAYQGLLANTNIFFQ
jgi:hypothetical protein